MNKCLITLAVAFSALISFGANYVEAADSKPNIIFFMADDLGYGDLGCFGQKMIKTPHIDKLCAEGKKFTDYYAGSTVCAPSRCVLVTGLHTGHAYIRGNGKDNLRPSDLTIGEVLKKQGYRTGCVGKWGVGHEGSVGTPNKKGFDFFFGYLDQHHAHNYYPEFLIKNDKRYLLKNKGKFGQWGQGVSTNKADYSHDLIMKEGLDFMESSIDSKEPFFMYFSITPPHANNEAGSKGMEIPSLGQYENKNWPEPSKGHAAMISMVDDNVGEILALLKKKGVDENTIFFFTSDNGPHSEGGAKSTFFDSNGPLRGQKRDLYEGGIRVPMIAHWPGKIKAGSESDVQWAHWDILPTCAELAGAEIPKNIDGISFVPSILDSGKQKEHDYLYWAFYERGSSQAVRKGDWKAVRVPAMNPKVELFNLKKDIEEQTDIAEKHPEIVAEMKKIMDAAYTPSERWKFPAYPPASKKKKKN